MEEETAMRGMMFMWCLSGCRSTVMPMFTSDADWLYAAEPGAQMKEALNRMLKPTLSVHLCSGE